MQVKVTQEVIDESIAKKSSSCMISQALRIAGASSTHVTAEHASFNMDGFRYTYPLPALAAAKLLAFDEDKTSVKPFKFTLSSNQGFVRPVRPRPDLSSNTPRPQKKKRAKSATRHKVTRSTRRYAGLRMIEVKE